MPFINRSFLFIVFCFTSLSVNSKVVEQLASNKIPAILLENASAVIRYDSTEINVESLTMVKVKRKYAITILKEDAAELSKIAEWYNNQSKINDISGSFYDASGKLIKSLKSKDIIDRSNFGIGYEFNTDSRIKTYSFTHNIYPYTIVFEMEKTLKSTFFIPQWDPQVENYCALENANIQISYPQDLNIRAKEYLLPATTLKTNTIENGIVSKSWTIKNIAAFEIQPLSTNGNYITPTIAFASSQFELLGFKGNMDTWSNFGLFNYQLNEGRDQLPESTKLKVHELIKNDTTTIEKVQSLYQFMQKNTRYVADEYGLAGWQTINADYVCTKGYGDCKGLTNYLKSLLKEAGITAYETLINAGDEHYIIDPQFPDRHFNHAILCIPNNKDTIWVESQVQIIKQVI